MIRIACEDISILGRVTSGVKLMDVGEYIKVASIARVKEESNKSDEDMLKTMETELEEESK